MSIIKKAADDMTEARKKANTLDSSKKQAHAYCEKVKPFFETIRYNVDKLEKHCRRCHLAFTKIQRDVIS